MKIEAETMYVVASAFYQENLEEDLIVVLPLTKAFFQFMEERLPHMKQMYEMGAERVEFSYDHAGYLWTSASPTWHNEDRSEAPDYGEYITELGSKIVERIGTDEIEETENTRIRGERFVVVPRTRWGMKGNPFGLDFAFVAHEKHTWIEIATTDINYEQIRKLGIERAR